jgi:hypothetical protein
MRRFTVLLACLAAGWAVTAMPASAAPLRSDNSPRWRFACAIPLV